MSIDDISETAIRRITAEDLEAAASRHESADAVYRGVSALRDLLSADFHKQLAVAFEWAREGIARQMEEDVSQELKELHAAYTYARDVMLEAANKGGR